MYTLDVCRYSGNKKVVVSSHGYDLPHVYCEVLAERKAIELGQPYWVEVNEIQTSKA